jgi:predicted  nucleic acid-binding Zn-ribbon protein
MEWIGGLSIIINAVLGGGFALQFFTLKSLRDKAAAEADTASATSESIELDNVEKAIKIWREMAESLKKELLDSRERYAEVALQVEGLRREVARVNCTSNKILKLLDRITVENIEKIVEQIKSELNEKDI